MKILFLTNVPSPYRVSFFKEWGKQVHLTVLYEKATADDRDSSWIVDGTSEEGDQQAAVGYHPVLLKEFGHGADKAFCPSVTRYLKDKQYDHIIVGVYSNPTGMYAINYMRMRGIPFFISIDGGFAPSSERKPLFLLKKYLLSGAKGYIASGSFCDEYLLHYGATKDRIHYFPFSSLYAKDVDEKVLSPSEKSSLKEELLGDEVKNMPVLLYVGQLIPRKGIDILLQAAAQMREECQFLLVGGEAPEEYLQLKEKLGADNVTFKSFISGEQLRNHYRMAELFVLPTREDIWGLVVNEAMAAGLPVVTTRNCGAGLAQIHTGNGRLVDSEDLEGFVSAIRECLALSDEEKLVMSENALKTAREYTLEAMAQAYQRAIGK